MGCWTGVGLPSGVGMASESQLYEIFGGGVTKASNRVQESWFMILLQDTCYDPDKSQI